MRRRRRESHRRQRAGRRGAAAPRAPARRRPGRSSSSLLALAALAVIVVAAIAVHARPLGAARCRRRRAAAAAAPVALSAASAYDPEGDGGEHDDEAPIATDGNAATYWRTEHYASHELRQAQDRRRPRAREVRRQEREDAHRHERHARLHARSSRPGASPSAARRSPARRTSTARRRSICEDSAGPVFVLWITSLPSGGIAHVNEVTAASSAAVRITLMAACARCGAQLPDDARFCPACGAPTDTRSVRRTSGSSRPCSSPISSARRRSRTAQDPERTRATLDRFYEAMAAEIERAGGTVEKFAGDAVMAAFGAPAALEDHAERALHCALAMRRRLQTLFDGGLALRIGVNTGDVVVGRPREGKLVRHAATRSTSRRGSSRRPEPGEILIGERTAALVRGAFELGEPRRVEAKGKDERRRRRAAPPRAVADAAARRRRAAPAPSSAATASSSCCSRPTRAPSSSAGRTWSRSWPTPASARRGSCASSGSGSARRTPEPVAAHRPLPRLRPRDHVLAARRDPQGAPRHPRERFARASSANGSAAARSSASTLGLDLGGELHPAGRARPAPRRVGRAARRARAPSVRSCCSLEDLHWAEEPLLDLLERLVRDVRGPLLVIATARPELLDAQPVVGRRHPERVAALARAAAEPRRGRAWSTSCSPRRSPTSLREVIVERAEGNPFFVEELIGDADRPRACSSGANGGWSASELPTEFEIPDTVQAVVAARIDLLPPAEKAALQAAAVIGRIFWDGPGRRAARRRRARLPAARGRGTSSAAAPARRSRASASTRSSTRVTREVAYASVPKARRARLHAAFARGSSGSAAAATSTRRCSRTTTRRPFEPEDADLAWADEPAERDAAAREGSDLAAPRRRARRRPLRPRRGHRAAAPGRRARGGRDGAGGALARDRPRERARLPRRRVLAGDGALARAHRRPPDPRRDVRRARLPDVVPRRHVDPRSGSEPRLVVDRQGASS